MIPAIQSPQAAPLPPQAQSLLEQMHDIITPAPVTWWPPAPGWWLLTALLIAAVIAVIVAVRQRHRANAYKRAALTMLDALQSCTDQELPSESNRLLKRVALVAFPSEQTAINQAFGDTWVDWLNQRCPHPVFSGAPAAALAGGGYQPGLPCPREELFACIHRWLLDHRRGAAPTGASHGRSARV